MGRSELTVLHVVVSGRVQGVGFRWFVRVRASRLGIAGWVRNRPDGSVEVAARGDADALATFERHLWAGPPGAATTVNDPTPIGASYVPGSAQVEGGGVPGECGCGQR